MTDLEPARPARRAVLLAAGLPLLVLLAAGLLIERRSPAGQTAWRALSPDTQQYVAMIEGRAAKEPFAFRRVVPLLASVLPLPPVQALAAITYVALAAAYALLSWVLLFVLRVRPLAAGLALGALVTCTRSLLMVQNPYLTDGFSFLMMSVMLACFLAARPVRFGLAAVLGVLAREDALFGAFAYLAHRRRRLGLVIAAVAVAAFLVSRGGHLGSSVRYRNFDQFGQGVYYVRAYFAFGFVWLLALAGLALAHRSRWRGLVPYFACALAGAVLSTVVASDTTRMFLPVLPVAVVACALAFDRLAPGPWLAAAWAALVLANIGLALPNLVLGRSTDGWDHLGAWYSRFAVPIALHQLAGIALAVISARRLHATAARP